MNARFGSLPQRHKETNNSKSWSTSWYAEIARRSKAVVSCFYFSFVLCCFATIRWREGVYSSPLSLSLMSKSSSSSPPNPSPAEALLLLVPPPLDAFGEELACRYPKNNECSWRSVIFVILSTAVYPRTNARVMESIVIPTIACCRRRLALFTTTHT